MIFDNLWVEKYRPANLDEMVMSDQNRSVIIKYRDSGSIPNLLFVGNAGIGKTSLAKIISKDILRCQYLYINASDENGIDMIRTKVTNFSRTKSFDGQLKVIILDETDGLSVDAQRALRNTMEEHAALTRFILTANYNHRIIPPLQSRCQSLDLTPPLEGCVGRVCEILKSEKISVPEPNTDEYRGLYEYVRACYPDLRKCINEIQKNTIDGEVVFENLVRVKDTFVASIYKITCEGLAIKARKKIIENEHVFSSDYTELLRSLFNHIHDSDLPPDRKTEHLVTVSEHLYRSAFVIDPEINFYSCLLALR
jgi:replication factor C small subunit